MMNFTKSLNKTDLILGLTTAAVVLLSGLVMNRLNLGHSQLAANGAAEIVSQNAIAPAASPDMPAVTAASCPVSLELLDEGNAMIGGTLLAPCLPSQDLVIGHAGLVFSAKTLASGALFFSLPALKKAANVDIRFADGQTASAQIDMPEVADLHRVAVQWPYRDGFSIHAFENGAGFDDPGHIWFENANAPVGGAAPKGGYLTLLGDDSVEMPLLAQVYTYPPLGKAEVMLEAAVTPDTCATDLMGDVLTAKSSAVQKDELTLAMPDCDAVGEYVQMMLPETPTNLALAN